MRVAFNLCSMIVPPTQVEALVASIRAQDGARVPGDRRKANRVQTERDGVVVNPAQQASLGLA